MVNFNYKEVINNLNENLQKLEQDKKLGIIVYTAIFGDFDHLNEVRNQNPNLSYVCFTDKESLFSNTWEIIKCTNKDLDPRLLAKIFKIFPHKIFKNASLSLWIDGNYIINKNHHNFFDLNRNIKHIKFYRHSVRNCIFKEAEYIKKNKTEFNSIVINRQMKKYAEDGMPKDQGLINGAIILRNHKSKLMLKLMDEWWKEILHFSIRDQLSFNYIDWKNGNNMEYFEDDISNFLYFTFRPHLSEKKYSILLHIKIYFKLFLGRIIKYVRDKR